MSLAPHPSPRHVTPIQPEMWPFPLGLTTSASAKEISDITTAARLWNGNISDARGSLP